MFFFFQKKKKKVKKVKKKKFKTKNKGINIISFFPTFIIL